jgi:hypothetical protein
MTRPDTEMAANAKGRGVAIMGVKDWVKQRKLKRLKGVAALDHGIVKGKGIPRLDRWEQDGTAKYWGLLSEKEAYNFYMGLPDVKETPRLRSITEFNKWNARRKGILETAEADFKDIHGIEPGNELSQAQRNKLGEFTRQRMNQLNDQLGSRI